MPEREPHLPGRRDDRSVDAAPRGRRRQRGLVLLAIAGTLAIALPGLVRPAPRLVWNASPSVPVGLYSVTPGTGAPRGATVLAWLPADARALADARHYLPRSVPVMKPVGAVAGDRVCARGSVIRIAGKIVARRLAADRRGRPLPRWEACVTLGRDQVFLLAPRRADSFDSRYFGPVERREIIGTARLLWSR